MRKIIHIDCDCFYAALEMRDDPSLRGKALAVGGSPDKRGVVATCSYEARAYGVRSAMAMRTALKLCPDLLVVRPRFDVYRAVSKQIHAIFRDYTDLIEPLSLDEAYLDVSASPHFAGSATRIAQDIRRRVAEELRITVSAGVAPNKFLAKIASGWRKPDGLTVIPPDRVERFLQGLPARALLGVGPVTARRLAAIGVRRLVEIRDVAPDLLRRAVGSQAAWLLHLAHGRDPRPVTPDRPPKSSGTERTFASDLHSPDEVRARVVAMVQACVHWLERRQLAARTITLKVRYADFTTVTRSHTERVATRERDALEKRAVGLLARTEVGRRAVRLAGVSVHGLEPDPDPGRARGFEPVLPFEG